MRLQARRPFSVGGELFGGPHVLTCVPLMAPKRTELIQQAERLGAMQPGCIEWRLDYLTERDQATIPALLAEVARAAGRPLVVTNRHHQEGGRVAQDEAHRLSLLEVAAATGIPALVDLELAAGAGAAGVLRAARAAGVRVIRSWHEFSATPPAAALLDRLRAAQESGADVAKVAVMPQQPGDVLELLSAGLEARRTFLEIPCILIAMGALGGLTRLGGGYFSSDLTFAAGESASAPGQMDLDLVRRGLAALGLGRQDLCTPSTQNS